MVGVWTSTGSYHPLIVLCRARCERRGKRSAPVGSWTTGWGASLDVEKDGLLLANEDIDGRTG